MKKAKYFLPVIAILFLANVGISQENPVLDGAYIREHVVGRTPIATQNIREADAMYSKKVLRVIELSEKINQPLYFPITRITYPAGLQPQRSRVNLLYLIYNIGILGEQYDLVSGEVMENPGYYDNRYPVYRLNAMDITNWYRFPIAKDDPIRDSLLAFLTEIQEYDIDGQPYQRPIRQKLDDTRDMDQLWFWEEWVFDRQRSVMDVKIIAMAPDGWTADGSRIWPFWIAFNDYRPLFASYEVFNSHNDAERRTFDDIFFKRRFKSYIVAETNNYDNRLISDYLLGIDAIREGEKIQEKIITYEHDFWEF